MRALNLRTVVRAPDSLPARCAAAVLLALAGIWARDALDPVFHATHTYTVFYPGVIVAAYFFGRTPAIINAVISIVVGYWCFTAPEWAWKADFTTLLTLMFFVLTSGVAIHFITGMRRALAELAQARAEAETLAESHADLFRNLNERVTNHLQLVAAILQLQARDEDDAAVGRALSEAAARTLLISRTHRSLAGEHERILDFDSFARQLLEAATAHAGASVRINIRPGGSPIPLDEATSVAVVLLECLNASLSRDDDAVLDIGFHRDERLAKLTVFEADAHAAPGLRMHLIEAMVEQLGGSFRSRHGADGVVSELEFPVGAPAVETSPSRMLH